MMRSLIRPRPLPPLGSSGVVALEYAIILPALILLIFGTMDVGRVLWVQVTLDRAVQAAARCASVNTALCSSPAATQTFAVSQSWGMTPQASVFTVTAPACGNQVAAAMPFTYVIPVLKGSSYTIHSRACYPVIS